MAKPPKLDRKELKGPDDFVKSGRRFLNFIVGQKRRFVTVAIGAVIVVAIVYAYDWWVMRNLNKAWQGYFVVTKLPKQDRWVAFEKFYEEQSRNRATFLAAVNLGDHYFDLRKTEVLKEEKGSDHGKQAVEWYGKALEYGSLLPLEKQLLFINRGKAHELDKQLEEALADFERAEVLGGDTRALALLNMGRIWEQKGDLEKAEKYYREVVVEYSDTEYARMAKEYQRVLKSPWFSNKKKS